jgi:hypothetical protein
MATLPSLLLGTSGPGPLSPFSSQVSREIPSKVREYPSPSPALSVSGCGPRVGVQGLGSPELWERSMARNRNKLAGASATMCPHAGIPVSSVLAGCKNWAGKMGSSTQFSCPLLLPGVPTDHTCGSTWPSFHRTAVTLGLPWFPEPPSPCDPGHRQEVSWWCRPLISVQRSLGTDLRNKVISVLEHFALANSIPDWRKSPNLWQGHRPGDIDWHTSKGRWRLNA